MENLEEGGAVGLPEGRGEVGVGYGARTAVDDYTGFGGGWF